MTRDELLALQRCTTRDAYKVLARYFMRTGKQYRSAGLKAAATAKQLKTKGDHHELATSQALTARPDRTQL